MFGHKMLFYLVFCASLVQAGQSDELWTTLHRKLFSLQERTTNKPKKELIFKKEVSSLFTQLIFSWNAIRPKSGHFSFWMQVRNAQTHQWSTWHQMSDWGDSIQKSYVTDHDGTAQFFHVRMQIPEQTKADGFAFKVIRNGKANLEHLYGVYVNCADMTKFNSETKNAHSFKLPSCLVHGVPKISQHCLSHQEPQRLCSPTSCSMLVQYLTKTHHDPCIFAEKSYDAGLQQYGSWPFNVAHSFEHGKANFLFMVLRLRSFAHLVALLERKIPVIVSVRGSLAGAPKNFPQGHLLVVIGYDSKNKRVVCHDPSAETDQEVVKQYNITDFLQAWERSHRLAYQAEPLSLLEST